MTTEQMSFELPDVDKKATKRAVENAFKAYRMYKHSPGYVSGPRANLTAAYPQSDADMIHGQNNRKTAGQELSEIAERLEMVAAINEVVDRLPHNEKTILKRTMMKDIDMCDPDTLVMDDMKLGKTKYYEVKWRAMLRVAFALRIEVLVLAERKAS